MIGIRTHTTVLQNAATVRNEIEISGLRNAGPAVIWYEFAGPDAPHRQSDGNFAIAAALPMAMASGQSLHLNGSADSDFLLAMENTVAAWCRWRPDLFKPIAITATTELAPRPKIARRGILAYSGGLDATFALHAHKSGLLGRRTVDIQAAVLVHGFDIRIDHQQAFDDAARRASAILNSYGIRLTTVRTNWKKEFAVAWEMTFVLGIASILHQFHETFDAGVFSDDFPYDFQLTPWSNNAITNQMLSSNAFAIQTTGADHGRTEKARLIGQNPVALAHLRVCTQRRTAGGNCGSCEKCLRTKLNFYASGFHDVPCLGTPLAPSDLSALQLKTSKDLYFAKDAISAGLWDAGDPIRVALTRIVAEAQVAQVRETDHRVCPPAWPKRLEKIIRQWARRLRRR